MLRYLCVVRFWMQGLSGSLVGATFALAVSQVAQAQTVPQPPSS